MLVKALPKVRALTCPADCTWSEDEEVDDETSVFSLSMRITPVAHKELRLK